MSSFTGWLKHDVVADTAAAGDAISARKQSAKPAPRIARYLRFSLQCRIPIPLKFTVPLAEAFRESALRAFGCANKNAKSFALSGHEPPMDVKGEHQHAFYLPVASRPSSDALLDEMHVWCPYGFTQAEVEALMRVQRLHWGAGNHPIRPVMLAIDNTVPDGSPISIGQICSRVWQSRTPFVPPRYFYRGNLHGAKLKVKDAPEQQLAKCLGQAGIAVPCDIRRLTPNGLAQRSIPPMAEWDIVRTPEGEEESASGGAVTAVHIPAKSPKREKVRRIGLFFELTFDTAVTFPMPALGHSNHFGLGLFVAVMQA